MGLDIRKPIGLMLLLTGLQLAAYGLLGSSEVYQRSLGINVNLWWGSALAVFGLIFFMLGRRG
jgi:hypothetical protein